jgi:hypothetical protein
MLPKRITCSSAKLASRESSSAPANR